MSLRVSAPQPHQLRSASGTPFTNMGAPKPPPAVLVEALLDKPAANGTDDLEDDECADTDFCVDTYSWEAGYDRTWDQLQEKNGRLDLSDVYASKNVYPSMSLRDSTQDAAQQSTVPTRKGTLRSVTLLLDVSDAMRETDYKPNRLHCTLTILGELLPIFSRANPLSRVAMVAMLHGQAITVSPLSGCLSEQIDLLEELRERDVAGGSVSLVNGLQRCSALLMASAPYATREIVVLFGSINTCDAGNIDATLQELKTKGIQITIIALTPEVSVLRRMARTTGGSYHVARSLDEYRNAILNVQKAPDWGPLMETRLVPMGFPRRLQTTVATLCVCHNRPSLKGYLCPRCRGKVCELPTNCRICDLHIASSVDVARTTQQYAPTPQQRKISEENHRCYMCTTTFQLGGFECTSCRKIFCRYCNQFRTAVLQQCPSCLAQQELSRRRQLHHA